MTGMTGPVVTPPGVQSLAISQDDVSTGDSGRMAFIGGAQGAEVTGTVPTIAALGSMPNLQPSDFLGGGVAGTTGAAGATGGFVQDAQRSNAQGAVPLDDSHGPNSIPSLFKPNS